MRPVVQRRHSGRLPYRRGLLRACVLVGIREPATQGRSQPCVELCLQAVNPLAAVIGEQQQILVVVPERVKAREQSGLHLGVKISGIEGKVETEVLSQTLPYTDFEHGGPLEIEIAAEHRPGWVADGDIRIHPQERQAEVGDLSLSGKTTPNESPTSRGKRQLNARAQVIMSLVSGKELVIGE